MIWTKEMVAQTIIFDTSIKNGVIEPPPGHRAHAGGTVRVIIDEASTKTAPDMIDQLLANPIAAPGFSPMARDARKRQNVVSFF